MNGAVFVYTGPTLPRSAAQALLPSAIIRPPVARGDLYRDREGGGAVFVVIDGMFTQQAAASPREVIDVARDGALVVGASSMGALRAAECWPAGVRGIGVLYRAFRLGVLESDDEVAVGTDQDGDYRAISVALVNVRYAVAHAVRGGVIDRPTGMRIVEVARRTFYAERSWRGVLREARVVDADGRIQRFCAAQDLKRRDAVQALETVGGWLASPGLADECRRSRTEPFSRPDREMFDPHWGRSPDELRHELVEWLFGSGRYQRYQWALLAHRPEFKDMAAEGRSERLRMVLCDVLAEVLPAKDAFATAVWDELAFLGELHAELARMYANRRLSDEALRTLLPLPPSTLDQVRDEVSVAHGAYRWSSLVDNVVEGRLCGAIPFAWIERCVLTIARGRCFGEQGSGTSALARPEARVTSRSNGQRAHG